MTPRHYSFASTWRIPAPQGATFDAVADLEHYALWWPQVRHVVGIDDDTARVAVRSLLPYTLHLTLHRTRVDARAGHLLAEIAGDLDGWASWRLHTDGGETLLRYSQEVVTTEPWMNAAGIVLSPVFRLNHAVMMRDGADGLTRHLMS
ncbi:MULTISPECIES: SRPBCC family protein [Mumia]|uniref:SRPBCC family protein n=1 Tax=Mumia TaxID=1546255 RepID=UPI001420586B|nr:MULTISPECIES: SRPBCC family protein [unclassified Mumia]QMW67868.1 SRPBCC family protein [Mumia sp. ZJ1417]